MNVLEKPDTIDETILDEELPCVFHDGGAEWLWAMRCCGAEAFMCATHDETSRAELNRRLNQPNFHLCGRCGHVFGFGVKFRDVYARRPV